MSFGKMTRRAEIIAIVRDKDREGYEAEYEQSIASVRCYREGKHGSEKWARMSSFSEATDLFRMRRIPGVEITTKHYIDCDGSRYNILSVEDVRQRGMYLEILAKRVEPSA